MFDGPGWYLLLLRYLLLRETVCVCQAAQETVRLEGDVITANGSMLLRRDLQQSDGDVTSVCSCRCNSCWPALPLAVNR